MLLETLEKIHKNNETLTKKVFIKNLLHTNNFQKWISQISQIYEFVFFNNFFLLLKIF